MGKPMGESDVARVLQIPVDSVRKLFEDGELTGARTDGEWRTTETLLEGDLVLLTENARVACLRTGKYVPPGLDDTGEGDTGHLNSDTLDEIIGRLRAHAK